MTAFLDWLSLLQLNVSIYHNLRVCGDWQITEHELGRTCFHIATQGGFHLQVPKHGEWQMTEGDLVIFPKEIPHTMTPNTPMQGKQKHLPIADAQDKEGTTMLCGRIDFVHRSNQHLLAMLPPVFVIKKDKTTAWLEQLLTLILTESLKTNDNSNLMLTRLCELLFSYALREFVENKSHKTQQKNCGILALYGHQKINRAINAIHQRPAHAWHLETLADKAGMSRTSFTNTFKQISAMTPMKYVTWWRMQLAWALLSNKESVANTAEQVGYQSEASFSRAFQKEFGVSAGSVRRLEFS